MLNNTEKKLDVLTLSNQIYLNPNIKTWQEMIKNDHIDRGFCYLSLLNDENVIKHFFFTVILYSYIKNPFFFLQFEHINGIDKSDYDWYKKILDDKESFHKADITLNDVLKVREKIISIIDKFFKIL